MKPRPFITNWRRILGAQKWSQASNSPQIRGSMEKSSCDNYKSYEAEVRANWATWMMFKPKKHRESKESLEHQAQQNRVLEDPISGGHQEPVTEEPWFKRRCETWREGQRSRLPKEPGPIGTSAKGSPLGGCCGDWSHSTCPLCWDQWMTHSTSANSYKWGRGKAPLCKYRGHRSCLEFNSTRPRKVQVVQWAHGTHTHLGAGETEKHQLLQKTTSPQYAREGESYNCNENQSATLDPIMGHEGQPGRRAAGCPDNLEAGSSSSLRSHG